ncbi:MAG TPA: Ku protein [Candidatus Polarisedimenticolia bacterium]|nr:Ku protein [Candidatus Polarisedimenticolia bacterium]
MARAIWKGSISFGLVSIPVALHGAENSEELSFHQLDRRDLNPVGYKRFNKKTDEEVPWDQVVRGYQYGRGRYVVVTDQDIKRANVEATQTIDIVGFVEGSQIPPLYYERPYYLEPQKGGAKAYALLRETLRQTGMVGVARVVIRSRQHMAALLERQGVLVLEILRWAHELREPKGLEVPDDSRARVPKKETDMAVRLVKGMAAKWEPKKYKDTFNDDLMALIRRRISSGKTTEIDESEPKAPPKRGGKVVDLMPLLRKSLEERGGEARSRSRARAHAAPGSAAASARGRSAGAGNGRGHGAGRRHAR